MTSQKCQICNNITTNPSGRCYLHEGTGSNATAITANFGTPSLSNQFPEVPGASDEFNSLNAKLSQISNRIEMSLDDDEHDALIDEQNRMIIGSWSRLSASEATEIHEMYMDGTRFRIDDEGSLISQWDDEWKTGDTVVARSRVPGGLGSYESWSPEEMNDIRWYQNEARYSPDPSRSERVEAMYSARLEAMESAAPEGYALTQGMAGYMSYISESGVRLSSNRDGMWAYSVGNPQSSFPYRTPTEAAEAHRSAYRVRSQELRTEAIAKTDPKDYGRHDPMRRALTAVRNGSTYDEAIRSAWGL